MDIEAEIDRIQGFVGKGNYHAAINIALSALNECRRTNDLAAADKFLDIIKNIVQILVDEYGS